MNVQQTLLLPHSINTLALMHLGNLKVTGHNAIFHGYTPFYWGF